MVYRTTECPVASKQAELLSKLLGLGQVIAKDEINCIAGPGTMCR